MPDEKCLISFVAGPGVSEGFDDFFCIKARSKWLQIDMESELASSSVSSPISSI
jgi:hypothetical protein